MDDYDSPWKEAMDRYFEWFMGFFFPRQHALIDWQRDSDSLDAELRKLAADSETGKRLVDKLVSVYRVDGEDRRLAHIEFQARKEAEFPHRLHVYNYRIEDIHRQPVWTLVLLADEDPDWRPTEYRFEEEGCERTLRWPLVKLLDYAARMEELVNGENLFGWLVVAQLVAQRTRNDPETRKEWKLRLLTTLYSRNLDGEDVRQWSRYFDWLLVLSEEDEAEVAALLEKEKPVPYVTSWERMGEKKGYQRGLLEATGALKKAIATVLEVRFGPVANELHAEILNRSDTAELQELIDASKTVASLDAFRALLG
jgi:hypothetical protein